MLRWLVALTISGWVVSGLSAAPIISVYPSVAPNAAASVPLGQVGTPAWRDYVPNALTGLRSANPAAAVVGTGLGQYATNYNPTLQWLTVSDQPLWRGTPGPFADARTDERGNRLHFGLAVRAGANEGFSLNSISFNGYTDPQGEAGLNAAAVPALGVVNPLNTLGRTAANPGVLAPVTDPNALLTELYYVGVGTGYPPYDGADVNLIPGDFASPPFTLPITQYPNLLGSLYTVRVSPLTAVPLPPTAGLLAGMIGVAGVARRVRRRG